MRGYINVITVYVAALCVWANVCVYALEQLNSEAPGPPVNLTVVSIHSRSVDLQWYAPENGTDHIRGYRVYYMRGNLTSVKTLYAKDDEVMFALHDLEPGTQYKVWAKAFTQRREGQSSVAVLIETDVSSPGPPVIANLSCQASDRLLLQWRTPREVYGDVDLYYIYFREEDSFKFEEIILNADNTQLDHNFLLTDLQPATLYELKMRAGTFSLLSPEQNHTYKGDFSNSYKFMLYDNCQRYAYREGRSIDNEMSSGVVAGIIFTIFALFLILIAMAVYHRFFRGAYYDVDNPPKIPVIVVPDWQSYSGSGGAYGSVEVQHFAQHVTNLHSDGEIGFSKEYEAIQAAATQDPQSSEHSQYTDNKPKNRYLNIVAYDHSRVPLHPLPGHKKVVEYVNANYIDGYDKPRAYIGTQGPLPSTFDTFWRMIWEQRVHIVVMITNLVERGRKKCDQYWPTEGTQIYEMVQVRFINETVMATYTIRKFAIKHLKAKCKKSLSGERIIYQYHYTNWPDHGTPDHPLPVLSFVRKSAAANPKDAGPIIVHCSAGVGRTGTYIVLDVVLQQIRNKGRLNIWGFLKHIRTQRNFLVQTEEQYVFIHDALVEAIRSGDTNIPRYGMRQYIKMLQAHGGSKDDLQHSYLLTQQFNLVTSFIPRDFNYLNAKKPVNQSKIRSIGHIPMEHSRVHLTPRAGCDGSDFINASWLQGHQNLQEFIITQHPTESTVLDFWQMMWDHSAQNSLILTPVDGTQGLPQIWPAQEHEFKSQHWKVRYLEESSRPGMKIIDCCMQSLVDDYELPVRLLHAAEWPQNLSKQTTNLHLVAEVQEIYQNYQNGPLVVVDRFGGTEAAIFCLMTTVKKQVDFDNHLDPYMHFRLYQNRLPHVWAKKENLLLIYQALESYCMRDSIQNGTVPSTYMIKEPVLTLPTITSQLSTNANANSQSVDEVQNKSSPTSSIPDIIPTSVSIQPTETCDYESSRLSNGHAAVVRNGSARFYINNIEELAQT